MKDTVFVFIFGYLPGTKYGGPVTSIYNFTQHFGDKYDIRIVCSNHDFKNPTIYPNIEPGWNTVGKASVLYLPESDYSEKEFAKIMSPFSVKMAYLSGIYSYKLNHCAIKACKKLNIPVVLATRGDICVNSMALKKWKKAPYVWVMKCVGEYNGIHFQVTSDEESVQLKKLLKIPDNRITLLPNIHGKSLDLPRPTKSSGKARLMFISRVHPKKNLKDALEALLYVKGEVTFDIYGPIEDEAYWETCKEIIKRMPSNVQIEYKGALNMQQARESYYAYHAFLFPTISENYGHVIVESLIASCPVIITKGTTPWDNLDGKAGYVVELHNIPALSDAINKLVDLDAKGFETMQQTLNTYRDEQLNLQDLLVRYELLISGQ